MTERTKYEIRSVKTGQVLDTTICPIVAKALHGNGFTVSPEPPSSVARPGHVEELEKFLASNPGNHRIWIWTPDRKYDNVEVRIDADGDLLIVGWTHAAEYDKAQGDA